jgi:general secretion pathway protein A
MYLDHWKLREKPFENTPDPRFLYPSRQHCEGLERMLYAIGEEKGCSLLTAEYGCGKTVLVRTVINNLDSSLYNLALINYPIFERDSFLREVAQQFGFRDQPATRAAWFRGLSRFFLQCFQKNLRNVLVIDEAQLIEDRQVFEELRLLLNIQLEDRFLLNILLVGQPELREKILALPQLEQRVAVRYHLHRFDQADMQRYVVYRLHVAGCDRPLFSSEALSLIYRASNGVPRKINSLCDLGLMQGGKLKADRVSDGVMKQVI